MCGIAGWSLSPNSTFPTRPMARHLLALSEDRGRDAAGFAYQVGDKVSVYKRPVLGGKLRLRTLPAGASTVLLHTRNMTVGDCKVDGNNHPVMSPNKRIAVVHNGVVVNHESMRKHYPDLPEVDSAVIPALLDEFGLNGLSELNNQSWAALGWLDTTTPDTLHLATTQGAPLVIVGLKDGSMVFASTFEAIIGAMKKSGIEDQFAWGYTAPPFTHYQVVAGAIRHMENVEAFSYAKTRFKTAVKPMSTADLAKLKSVTSGAASSKTVATTSTTVNRPNWTSPYYKSPSSFHHVEPAPTRDPNGPSGYETGAAQTAIERLKQLRDAPPRVVVAPTYRPPVYGKGGEWGNRMKFSPWVREPADLEGKVMYWSEDTDGDLYVGYNEVLGTQGAFRTFYEEVWEDIDNGWVSDFGFFLPDGERRSLTEVFPASRTAPIYPMFNAVRNEFSVFPLGERLSDFPDDIFVDKNGYAQYLTPDAMAEMLHREHSMVDEEPDEERALTVSEEFAKVNEFLAREADTMAASAADREGLVLPSGPFVGTHSVLFDDGSFS